LQDLEKSDLLNSRSKSSKRLDTSRKKPGVLEEDPASFSAAADEMQRQEPWDPVSSAEGDGW
jgi:hypothetical protein